MKEKVSKWIEDGCDFNHGVALLSETGKHNQLIRSINGRPHRYADKLLYELCKAAGVTISEFNSLKHVIKNNSQSGDATLPPAEYPPVYKLPGILAVPVQDGQLSADIEKVIKEHADMFKLRAQLHEQMSGLPEENSEDTVKTRKILSDSIAIISPRIDLLFASKEAYFTKGIFPDLAILFPEPVIDHTADEPLPDDISELKKLKKNLQSANTKDQNQLEYQDDKKAEKSIPMPAGPKRKKLEQRVKDRIQKIEKIDFKLLEIAG